MLTHRLLKRPEYLPIGAPIMTRLSAPHCILKTFLEVGAPRPLVLRLVFLLGRRPRLQPPLVANLAVLGLRVALYCRVGVDGVARLVGLDVRDDDCLVFLGDDLLVGDARTGGRLDLGWAALALSVLLDALERVGGVRRGRRVP